MRGKVTIKSITNKINQLMVTEANLVKKLEDVRSQITRQKIKRNELIAEVITSQVDDLDEKVLQKILTDYNKVSNSSSDSKPVDADKPSAPQTAQLNTNNKVDEEKTQEPKPVNQQNVSAPLDKGANNTAGNNPQSSNDVPGAGIWD